jgi:hypothetical protein
LLDPRANRSIPMAQIVSLDTILLQLSETDFFTLRHLVLGLLIMGGIGSGKTSGSKALRRALRISGLGGLVLCAKPGEAEMWRRECAEDGRSGSVIVVNGRNDACFNFIAYELERHGPDGINSVIECLMCALEAAQMAGSKPGRGGEQFWIDATKQLLRAIVPLLYFAWGNVTIPDIIRLVRSAPQSREEAISPEWRANSFLFATLLKAGEALGDDHPTIDRIASYWFDDFAKLDPKTRGNIVISLTTTLDRFNGGWLERLFCGETTITPELSFHGAILILDMPALTMNEDGIFAQILFKFMWQRAVLARGGLDPSQRQRPVFLWVDEAHHFLMPSDADFLSTSRESLACPVFLSQSLPTFYAKMGGEHPRETVHQLLGNFATRVWHNNACHETNKWASETVGKSLQQRANYSEGEGSSANFGMNMGEGENWGRNSGTSSSHGGSSGGGQSGSNWSAGSSSGSSWGSSDNRGLNRGSGTSSNVSHGYSEQMDDILTPGFFSSALKTGGPPNGNRVSAVWFQAGRKFEASRGNCLLTEFEQ